jgi:hypothetical protein
MNVTVTDTQKMHKMNVIGADLNPAMSTFKLCVVVLLNVLFILWHIQPLLDRHLETDEYSRCYAVGS